MEEWKDIKGFEGFYMISSLGRTKSLDRVIYRSNGRKQHIKEKIKKCGLDDWGYLRIRLGHIDNWKTYKVHRLVALHFLENKLDKPEVNHKNGVKTDNRVSNLEWCTTKENSNHAIKNNLHKPCLGENNKGGNKLTNELVKEMRENYSGETYTSLSKKYSISITLASNVIKRKNWKHI